MLKRILFNIKFFLLGPDVPEEIKTKPLREVSYADPLSEDVDEEGRWIEEEISDCKFGCKIYRNTKTEERVIGHSSAYGCYK